MWTPEFIAQMVVMVSTVGAMYGGIRTDLKNMHQRIITNENNIEEARKRMDNHIDRGR